MLALFEVLSFKGWLDIRDVLKIRLGIVSLPYHFWCRLCVCLSVCVCVYVVFTVLSVSVCLCCLFIPRMLSV